MSKKMSKKSILVLNGQYLPGYKGGGPIQSCVNMIENMANEYQFYVLTGDRDFKSDEPYENIKINQWNRVGAAKVFYMSPDKQNIKDFKRILESIEFDILYLNGFFSPIFTIKPLILGKLGFLKGKKIILTPRGDFTGGCENKKLKKYTYIYLCKIIGLYNNLLWHATSELEEKDIKRKFKKAEVFTVSNLSAKYIVKEKLLEKKSGDLKLVFISRIFPKKNLKFALEILKEIKQGEILFDIYGPMEDEQYWEECKNIINKMPANVKVEYKGEVEHSEIENIFSQYHAFLFPTLGENYGHVIVESMMAGCLLLISDTTPWRNLKEKNIGWDISLSNSNGFKDSIKEMINMNQHDFNIKRKRLEQYVCKISNNSDDIKIYENVFENL